MTITIYIIQVREPIEKKGNGGFAMFCFKMVIAGSLMSIVYMGYKMYEQKIQKQFWGIIKVMVVDNSAAQETYPCLHEIQKTWSDDKE